MTRVAAPVLRVVRRPKGALTASVSPSALTAASAPVVDVQNIFKSTGLGGRRNDWQNEAWDLLDAVGEFRFYVRWRASTCSRVRLVASEIDPDTGLPTGSVADDNREGQRVVDLVRRIADGPLGQAQLVKRSVEILSVPGEYWIAILTRKEGAGRSQRNVEKWYAVTREEIERGNRSDSVVIALPDGTKHDFDPAKDGLFRVWNPHPRRATEADSPARGVLEPMREIVRTTDKISNADLSRLISAGILVIPQEASLPPTAAPTSAGKPGEDTAPAAPTPQTAMSLQRLIVENATIAAREGPKSAAATLPLVIAAPGDHIDKIKRITFGDEITKVALDTRNDAIARLAMGLDMAPEQLLGLGSNSNHWSSHLLEDQDVQVHVSPVMQTICGAIYESSLGNLLEAQGIDRSKYTLWYDTSPITIDPDKTDEAGDAYAKGAITAETLVRAYGLPDDAMYDFTTLEGWQQWAQDKVSTDPTLLRDLLPLLDSSVQAIEFPDPRPALPAGETPPDGEDGLVDPGDEPDTEDDGSSRPVVAAAGARDGVELAVVDLLVGRALELAGKRRVRTNDREQHDRLRGVAARDYHRYMEPVNDMEVGRLIKGWDEAFDDQFAAAHGIDPERVRSSVRRLARHELTRQVVDGQVI